MKQLYYSDREFYWLTETPKTIKVEWIPKMSGDTFLDQNVDYKNLTAKKDNHCKHCLRVWDDGTFTIYPNRSGQPMYLEPATLEHIDREIAHCKGWGVGDKYYRDLRKLIKE